MLIASLILFGIVLVCACAILGRVIYSYFEISEEFAKMTPDEIFMFHYKEVKRLKNDTIHRL